MSHGFSAFVTVIALLFSEIFLAIISLPLYVVEAAMTGSGKEVKQYRLRRVLTLGMLSAIFVIWFLKMAFILGLSLSRGESYRITEVKPQATLYDTVNDEVLLAQLDRQLSAPHILSVKEDFQSLILRGTAPAKATVAISFVREEHTKEDKNTNFIMSAVDADTQGSWQMVEDRDVFSALPGKYIATAVSYQDTHQVKSVPSDPVAFEVHHRLLETIFMNFDRFLNIIVILFLLVGLGSMVLMV